MYLQAFFYVRIENDTITKLRNMKQYRFVSTMLIAGLALSFAACQSDEVAPEAPGPADQPDQSDNQWIEEKMRNLYYWYNEIPDKSRLNYEASAADFFNSLLSLKDGKDGDANNPGHYYYSYLEEETAMKSYQGSKPSLGFEFQLWRISSNEVYAVNVLYVLPGSPASQAGLKRGDWIMKINDNAVKPSNAGRLTDGSIVKLALSADPEAPATKSVTLTPSMVTDNPVYLDTIFDASHFTNIPEALKNKKIGYLVYNHFTSGPGGDYDETFNHSLREAFSRFKAGNTTDFILDLRYNSGGVVTSAQLLSTMLAPASALNQEFCHIVYNDKNTSHNSTLKFDTKYMKEGAAGENLDLKKLVIITSQRTASSSEAVINGLRPYMGNNIILIGEQTEGKNVGSVTIQEPARKYILHPIVCRIYNKSNQSDYANGFPPNYSVREEGDYMEELGDTNEYLLNIALQHVLFGDIAPGNKAKAVSKSRFVAVSKPSDHKTNAILIPERVWNANQP